MKIKLAIFMVVIISVLSAYFAGSKIGREKAVAEFSLQAAISADKAKKRQAVEQESVNLLAFEYYKAIENEKNRSNELNSIKSRLRVEIKLAGSCRNIAAYRMFNRSASSEYLSDNQRTKTPDAEEDGLDAIQYSVEEYNQCAIQVNKLQEVISSSECFRLDLNIL